jgi:ferric-dicitrate binding protein FerR (iron transport regulator)
VSRHVAPHRWADAFAGKLAADELDKLERHADECASCARARARIQRASQSFPALRAQPAPDLAWDGVRARVHWSVSTERHARVADQRRVRPYAIAAGAVLAAGVLGLAIATGPFEVASTPVVAKHDVPPPSPAPAPAPLAGLVSRLTGQVMIDGVRRDDAFDLALVSGTVLATGDGRVDVQFGDHSAFALGPRSTLELRRFDAESIELVVAGTIDVEVAPRAPHQRFVVIAGDRTIEVRGTQFRVDHDERATYVACRHGLVAVRDARGEIEVASARKLDVAAAAPVADAKVVALSARELDQLAAATPASLPLWTDAQRLVDSSAALEIATVGRREVRVDGVELGEAPLRVRVMPGRHTVETADRAGRFHRAGWVDVEPGKAARIAVQPEVTEVAPSAATAARRHQLRAGLDHARLASCARAIRKAGLSAYVTFEIAIDETGAVEFLNVVDTDLPSSTRSCVRDVLADVQFRSGPAATFRDKLDL